MNITSSASWNTHYNRNSSILVYPDEQLVRMLSKYCLTRNSAIDIGCGTGRHVKLLHDFGFKNIVGIDISYNALLQCKKYYNNNFINCSVDKLPFHDATFDVGIAWGSLHYTTKDMLPVMLDEIKRILKTNGKLFGTLRSNRDTYITKGTKIGNDTWETSLPDIKGAIISLYSYEEVQTSLKIFSEFHIGLMERTLLDNMDSLLSHWFFYATV